MLIITDEEYEQNGPVVDVEKHALESQFQVLVYVVLEVLKDLRVKHVFGWLQVILDALHKAKGEE